LGFHSWFFQPSLVCAEEYVVGDEGGWNSDVDYYAWSDGKKFYVGDILGNHGL
jgi:hypothetical protein